MSFAEGMQLGLDIVKHRDQQRMLKQQRDQNLAIQGYAFDDSGKMSIIPNSPADVAQAQNKESMMLFKALQGKLLANETDTAFTDYAASGDASYFQRARENNPDLDNLWTSKGVQQVANIDYRNDSKLLGSVGFSENYYDTDEKKDIISKNFFKVYDGQEWKLVNAADTAAMLGVTRRLGDRRSQDIVRNQQNFQDFVDGPKPSRYTADGHKYQALFTKAGQEFDISPDLLAAQAGVESNFNAKAVSPKGAGGIMQIMPETAKHLGINDVFNEEQNVRGGAKYMRELLDMFKGDLPLALAAYNAGPAAVKKYGGIPPYPETQDYVRKVMNNLDEGQSFYGSDSSSFSKNISDSYANRLAQADTVQTDAPVSNEDIILESQAKRVQAAKGLTPDMIAAEQDLKTQKNQMDFISKQQDIQTRQTANDLTKAKLDLEKQKLEQGPTTTDTATQKNLTAADTEINNLVESFGGAEKFFNTDFSIKENRAKAMPTVRKIEVLTQDKLSEGDKTKMSDLAHMVKIATQINFNPDNLGIFDTAIDDLKRKMKSDVSSEMSKAAVSTMRNITRNLLFGQTLTPSEVEQFNKMLSDTGIGREAFIAQYYTSFQGLKSNIDSLMSFHNPYVMQVYMGSSKKDLDTAISNVDYAMKQLEGLRDPSATPAENATKLTVKDVLGMKAP